MIGPLARIVMLTSLLAGYIPNCSGQLKPLKDSILNETARSTLAAGLSKPPDLVNTLIVDFFTTLNAIHYTNAREPDQLSQVYFYYNFTISNNARLKRLALRTNIFNEYGFRYYVDSLSQKAEDQYYIRNTLQVPIRKQWSFQGSFNVKTQLWKSYGYRTNTAGSPERYLYSDYFSPGYLTYSVGLSVNFLDNGTASFGLIGGKTTRIKNQKVFEERKAMKLYGLEKGEHSTVAFGMNLLVNVPPQRIQKHLAWELSGQVFAPKDQLFRIKGYTLNANNALHYIFLKYLRLSLRTQAEYNEQDQNKVLLINHLSLGFYLSNKF